MRHKQFAIHQMNVGFNAAESVVQRIKKRTFVLVIVMCMDTSQGLGFFLSPNQGSSSYKDKCEDFGSRHSDFRI
jgi:hypothetical protein